MSPNVTCLLIRWGLGDALQSSSVVPQDCNFRRWQNGEVISRTLLNPKMQEDFGSPYWVLHRAHLLECLHNRATELGAITHLNSRVATVDLESCTVTTKDGVCYSADVIVGCDGIKSAIRPYLLSHPDPGPRKTAFACYRATVPMENLGSLSATTSIVQQPDLNIWIGEGRHVMTYPIAGGKTFNLVLSHPYDSSKSNSLAPTAAEVEAEMLQNYKGWDPV
jgi:salicylate hydroxylase